MKDFITTIVIQFVTVLIGLVSEEKMQEIGIKQGEKIAAETSGRFGSDVKNIENPLQKKFNAYIEGINIGLDKTDPVA